MQLTFDDRKTIIETILSSDIKYFEKLVNRKIDLMLELQSIEDLINKKSLEIQGIQFQLSLIETMH